MRKFILAFVISASFTANAGVEKFDPTHVIWTQA